MGSCRRQRTAPVWPLLRRLRSPLRWVLLSIVLLGGTLDVSPHREVRVRRSEPKSGHGREGLRAVSLQQRRLDPRGRPGDRRPDASCCPHRISTDPSPFSVFASRDLWIRQRSGGWRWALLLEYLRGLYGYAIDGGSARSLPSKAPRSRATRTATASRGDFLVLRRLPSNLESRIDVFRPRPDGSATLVGSTQGDPLQGLLVVDMVGDPLGRFAFVSLSPYYAPTTRLGESSCSTSETAATLGGFRLSVQCGSAGHEGVSRTRRLLAGRRSAGPLSLLAVTVTHPCLAHQPGDGRTRALADTPLEAHRVPTAAVCSCRR